MPRRKRSMAIPGIYHITHRCHNKEFLLKFGKYRDLYLDKLLEMIRRYPVAVLNYMVTSNHVHLLVSVKNPNALSAGLHYLHGQVARKYNYLKKREGAFWSNRFYSTLIQDGEYFGHCLFYIDMNMVRAGVVEHPGEWQHTAWHEYMGNKKYKLIVNFPRLLNALMINDMEHFREWYEKTLAAKLTGIMQHRKLYWSRSRAVGGQEWLARITGKDLNLNIYQNSESEPFYLNFSKIE